MAYAQGLLAAEKPAISTLQMEQIVPVYDLLLYCFDETKKATKKTAASITLYQTDQRYPLWPLICAPIVQRSALLVQTTSRRIKGSKNWTSTVELLPEYIYLPRAAYSSAEARSEAQSTQIADSSRVVIVHSHTFTKLDAEPPNKESKTRGAASQLTLARYVAPAGALPYTVYAAVEAALERTGSSVSINGRIPAVIAESESNN